MHCLRPDAVVEAAANFVAGFPGDVLYAVKCNPDPAVLLAVWDGGVRHFDCASAPEIALVRRLLPDATIHFMHPRTPRWRQDSRRGRRAGRRQFAACPFCHDGSHGGSCVNSFQLMVSSILSPVAVSDPRPEPVT
jgi:Pyridoxal-dependent decarboxylase, pyridoxal binding domain